VLRVVPIELDGRYGSDNWRLDVKCAALAAGSCGEHLTSRCACTSLYEQSQGGVGTRSLLLISRGRGRQACGFYFAGAPLVALLAVVFRGAGGASSRGDGTWHERADRVRSWWRPLHRQPGRDTCQSGAAPLSGRLLLGSGLVSRWRQAVDQPYLPRRQRGRVLPAVPACHRQPRRVGLHAPHHPGWPVRHGLSGVVS
jgi:hypothetical protein